MPSRPAASVLSESHLRRLAPDIHGAQISLQQADGGQAMIGYVMLGANNYERALDFYDRVLAPIGAKRAMDFGVSTAYSNGQGAMLVVTQPFNKEPATSGNGTMIALQMPSKEKVHEVYDAAIANGARCEGPAGARGETFYAGYFRDLDGNKLCAFFAPGM
jgi:catechol 2,3-dioxygenase-like lactoylglutathione lyase family enzyme